MSETQKAKLILDAKTTLGEGPVWDYKKQLLFWVDIEGCHLHAHKPSTGVNQRWHFDEMLGAAVPTESGKLLLALASGLASFALETETLLPHQVLENTDPQMRFNDGKVSPNGTFWIGSMHKKFAPKTGSLYQVKSNFKSSVLIPKTTISNGMAWTSDAKKFYFIDSPTFQVRSYDFLNDTISNGKTAFKIPKNYGSPDGMCIDNENMLWIAHWGGNCICRWNPITGVVLEKISIPAPHVTSCCFGGEDLKTLYITTARSGLTMKQMEEFPLSGGLFTYTPKIAGTPITYFKDK